MAKNADRRGDPRTLWSEVRAVVMLGFNYGPADDPLAILKARTRGAISVYAQGDDYHELIKPRLKGLGRWLVENAGGDIKVFVDTAPVMEKPLAEAAGLGWQGKHTRIWSRANTARGCSSARSSPRSSCRPTDRTTIIAAPVAPASASARPAPSRRRIASMRGAASPISPSSTRARSRANCVR